MTTNVSKHRCLYNGLWYGGFWLLLTLWLRLALPESIMGWERHQLFRYANDYWTSFFDTTYPILLYIQAFFTQFYFYPLLGAGVMGGLLVLGMGAWHCLTEKRWPGAVWAALMLPLIPYFNLLWILIWLILLWGALLIKRGCVWRLWLRYMVFVLVGVLSVLLLQENGVLAMVFWAVVAGIYSRSWKNGLCALGFLGIGVALGIGLLFWKGYPYYYTAYFQHFSLLSTTYIADPFPSMFFACPLFIRVVTYIGLAVSILLPLMVLTLPSISQNEKPEDGVEPTQNRRNYWISSGLGVIIGTLLIYAGYLNLRYQMEDFYLVYRLTAEQRYTEALNVTETAFFERTPKEEADNRRDEVLRYRSQRTTLAAKLGVEPVKFQQRLEKEYMADALRVALLNDKQATSRLFFYNGLSYFPLLFTENVFLMPAQHFVALYYTQNGLYAEALHLLYDFITTGDASTAILEPLLWNSVVVEDYAPCRKFIRQFEQSLFRKDIARRYSTYLADTAATAKRAEIAAARLRLSSHNHTIMAYYPDDNIHFRLRYEANQAPIYEYALALWMVYKNHPQILAELPKIRQYYPRLPRHVQEAVLANFKIDQMDEIPAGIDPDTKARYVKFMEAYEMYMNGILPIQKLNKNFSNTYWFHLYFNRFQPSTVNLNGSQQI